MPAAAGLTVLLPQLTYANRRAQIYGNLREALSGQFKLPDRDDLHSELVSMGYKFTSAGAVQIESKDDIRKRLGASPDLDLIP
jgi:phage terminase large subunit